MKEGWKFRIIVVVILMVTFTLGHIGISFASDAAAPPAGSYTKTCDMKTIQFTSTEITSAKCKKLDGSWNTGASLTYSTCTGDIMNCNGNLRCSTTGNSPPDGGYKKSCICCYTKMKLDDSAQKEIEYVCCLCKQKNGKYNPVETCYPTTTCTDKKQIQNIDGTLTCK